MAPEVLFEHPVIAQMAALDPRAFVRFVQYAFERAGFDVAVATGLHGADLELRSNGSTDGPITALVQVRDGRVERVAAAGVESMQSALKHIPGAVGYVITPNDFAQIAYERAAADGRISLINGERLHRYITYVKGSRLHPSKASSIAPDHLVNAEQIRRRPLSRTKVLTLANNKGGVGKTTTALNLAFGLARPGKPEVGSRVLVVDLDAQANLTRSLPPPTTGGGWLTLKDYFTDQSDLAQLVRPTRFDNLWLIPGHPGLQLNHSDMRSWPDVELAFVTDLHRDSVKPSQLAESFDWIVIDTPPAMSLHARAAIAAAHYVLAPANASAFADPGLNNLFDTIRAMRALMGNEVRMLGCVPTDWENGATQAAMLRDLDNNLLKPQGVRIFKTKVPHDLKVDQSHLELGRGKKKTLFDLTTRGAAAAYESLLEEMLGYVNDA